MSRSQEAGNLVEHGSATAATVELRRRQHAAEEADIEQSLVRLDEAIDRQNWNEN